MKAALVEFQTKDKLFLPGLLYKPSRKTKKLLITLHGNGSSSVFYGADSNILAQKLAENEIGYFPFNNRGAHYIKKIKRINDEEEKERVKYGMTYELIKECLLDIDGALDFLEKQGFSEFYLIGFSTGANKICVYNYYKPDNRISKYILAGSGDDTGIIYNAIGGRRKFLKYVKKAKKNIDKGKGKKLIPKYILDWLISYQSFYDEANPDGDYNTFPFYEYMEGLNLSTKKLFREYKSIKKLTLVVYGENDEYCYGDVERIVNILKKEAPNKKLFDFKIIKDTDHGFSGKEEELAAVVSDWLSGKK